MTSPSADAYEKLSQWMLRGTTVKVVAIIMGNPEEVFWGTICAVDPTAERVGVSVLGAQRSITFEMTDAVFTLSPTRLVAKRSRGDSVNFEECGS
jgi:hypothetical protein